MAPLQTFPNRSREALLPSPTTINPHTRTRPPPTPPAVALLATIALWVRTTQESAALRSHAVAAQWSTGSVAANTLEAQAWLESALSCFAAFKVCACVGVGDGTLRHCECALTSQLLPPSGSALH